MGMKKNYTCDICRDSKPIDGLVGCYFTSYSEWRFSLPTETDGTHICNKCLDTLRVELGKLAEQEASK